MGAPKKAARGASEGKPSKVIRLPIWLHELRAFAALRAAARNPSGAVSVCRWAGAFAGGTSTALRATRRPPPGRSWCIGRPAMALFRAFALCGNATPAGRSKRGKKGGSKRQDSVGSPGAGARARNFLPKTAIPRLLMFLTRIFLLQPPLPAISHQSQRHPLAHARPDAGSPQDQPCSPGSASSPGHPTGSSRSGAPGQGGGQAACRVNSDP